MIKNLRGMKKLQRKKLNQKQVSNLKGLISAHIHEMLTDKEKAARTFKKIKKYGVSTMPEAIALYKCNKLKEA